MLRGWSLNRGNCGKFLHLLPLPPKLRVIPVILVLLESFWVYSRRRCRRKSSCKRRYNQMLQNRNRAMALYYRLPLPRHRRMCSPMQIQLQTLIQTLTQRYRSKCQRLPHTPFKIQTLIMMPMTCVQMYPYPSL